MPTQRAYHDYGRHNHLTSFDRAQGFEEYRVEINTMLRRCGHPYEIDVSGRIQRLGPPVLREELESVVFASGDAELDRLLETGRRKFRDPDLQICAEALEKLWDAWERLKTISRSDVLPMYPVCTPLSANVGLQRSSESERRLRGGG